MSTAALIVAIYAACVSTGTLAWQVHIRSRSPKAAVKVEHTFAMLPYHGGHVEDAIAVKVINQGTLPVRVTGVAFDLQDGSGRTAAVVEPVPGSTIPGVVAPGDAGECYQLIRPMMGSINVAKPFRAVVHLAGQESVRSKPHAIIAGTS